MSTNIFNRDDGNKFHSYAQIDKNFDSYWENEARNPNRNRIRIGRQYQATVPAMLKQGETDKRKLSDTETLKWTPSNKLQEQQVDFYVQMAKVLDKFERPVPSTQRPKRQAAVHATNGMRKHCEDEEPAKDTRGARQRAAAAVAEAKEAARPQLNEFIAAHHSQSSLADCFLNEGRTNENKCTVPAELPNWTPAECEIFAYALAACGKNFALIRKEFLPWKCGSSIMDLYYYMLEKRRSRVTLEDAKTFNACFGRDPLVPKEEQNTEDGDKETSDTSQDNDIPEQQTGSTMSDASSGNCTDDQGKTTQENGNEKQCNGNSAHCVEPADNSNDSSVSGDSASDLNGHVPNAEDACNLGSLKFYKDGQLVLKLNAKQQRVQKKCQWEESADSVAKLRPLCTPQRSRRRRRYETDTRSVQSGSRASSEDRESIDSALDEDSLDSADSVPTVRSLAVACKKARVKVENNCHIPLPSPAISVKADDDSQGACSGTISSGTELPNTGDFCGSPSPPNMVGDLKLQETLRALAEKQQSPPAAHAASRPFDRLAAANLALDLTRKLTAGNAFTLQDAGSQLLSPPPAHQYKAKSAFEALDFALNPAAAAAAAAAASLANHSFLPANLLQLIKGVNSK